MIDLKLTEERIETLIDVSTLTIPSKLRLYPGSLDDLGKPISCSTIVVQFKNIEYEDPDGNRFGNCRVPQMNSVRFDILVINNNLRSHRDIYTLACEIIERVRGQQILINKTGDAIQGTSPARILDFTFGKIENGGACYQSTITVESMFTDVYEAATLI